MALRSTWSCSQRSPVFATARDILPRLAASCAYSLSFAMVAFVGILKMPWMQAATRGRVLEVMWSRQICIKTLTRLRPLMLNSQYRWTKIVSPVSAPPRLFFQENTQSSPKSRSLQYHGRRRRRHLPRLRWPVHLPPRCSPQRPPDHPSSPQDQIDRPTEHARQTASSPKLCNRTRYRLMSSPQTQGKTAKDRCPRPSPPATRSSRLHFRPLFPRQQKIFYSSPSRGCQTKEKTRTTPQKSETLPSHRHFRQRSRQRPPLPSLP